MQQKSSSGGNADPMAPNACSSCRAKKLKCTTESGQTACVRCSTRDTPCSFEPVVEPCQPIVPNPSGEHIQSLAAHHHRPNVGEPAYRLKNGHAGLDISRGRPQEILRENQLTLSLVQLYFVNYSDIHFMLDEETTLRQLATGELPKVLLYSIMALAIRFSHAPFDDNGEAPYNRGEIMFDHARQLLQHDFDRLSITNIHVYILLSTYKLSYGGPAQAHTYLSIAANILQLLRVMEYDGEFDPVRIELDRRMVATMRLVDYLVSGPLQLPPLISSQYATPTIMSDEEFWAVKRRTINTDVTTMHFPTVAIPNHLVRLSSMLHSACSIHHKENTDNAKSLMALQVELRTIREAWDPSLQWNEENLSRHRAKDTIRRFLFFHLLYNHVGQVVHFQDLGNSHLHPEAPSPLATYYGSSMVSQRDQQRPGCYAFAQSVVTIAEYARSIDLDLHNFQVGQILVVATVVLTRDHLARAIHPSSSTMAATPPTMWTIIESSTQIGVLREYIIRNKRHTRMYEWVFQQFELFCQLCRSSTHVELSAVFENSNKLLRELLRIGSFYERRDFRTGCRKEGIEALFYPDEASPVA